jgi:hypothetical protein
MPKISQLTELAEDPAGGDMLAIVDVSAGQTKKVRADRLGGGGAALTYPTFTWDHYNHYTNGLLVSGSLAMPLDTTDGAVPSALPSGWSITAAPSSTLLVPAGLYSGIWYWEDYDSAIEAWDNYVSISGAVSGTTIYATAPKAHVDGYFGSVSFTARLPAGGSFRFAANNEGSGDHSIYSVLTVVRTDA